MRTTLSIDDDIASSIEALKTRENASLREIVNQLLRAGLKASETKQRCQTYKSPVFDSELKPGIDPNRMNQLADELETEEFVL
jgi:hypothetical protein